MRDARQGAEDHAMLMTAVGRGHFNYDDFKRVEDRWRAAVEERVGAEYFQRYRSEHLGEVWEQIARSLSVKAYLHVARVFEGALVERGAARLLDGLVDDLDEGDSVSFAVEATRVTITRRREWRFELAGALRPDDGVIELSSPVFELLRVMPSISPDPALQEQYAGLWLVVSARRVTPSEGQLVSRSDSVADAAVALNDWLRSLSEAAGGRRGLRELQARAVERMIEGERGGPTSR